MHTSTAYDRRETLTESQLERLRAELMAEVDRYRDAIRGYSQEKMARYGSPYLAGLEAQVAEVERLLAIRSRDS
jgi:septum formation topological specificity factor MinE